MARPSYGLANAEVIVALLSSISLYTGAGGLDLGLHAAGFGTRVAVEREPVAVSTLRRNQDRWGQILGADIHSLMEDRPGQRALPILQASGLREGEASLLAGGPPCQPFSKSGFWATGASKRLDDPRARTLDAWLDVLETALPEVYLLENVPGLTFSAKDDGLGLLRRRIEEINASKGTRYSFAVQQLNAAAFGVPQLRERVFVIGHREGRVFQFPRPTHHIPASVDMAGVRPPSDERLPDGLLPATTAWDAIGHLEEDPDPRLLPRGKWAPVLATIPEGSNYLWHTDRGGGIPLWGWRTRYWSMLLKLAKARPSWTLTASPGPAIGPFHWKSRRLSAEELKGLQTFPADYRIEGDVMDAHLQLGNAVPSALSELLGREIRRQLLGHAHVDPRPTLLPTVRRPIPPPEPIAEASLLPPALLAEVGTHEEHPGTGKGPGARRRAQEDEEQIAG